MARWSLAAFWFVAGTMHFVAPRFYDAIVPPPLDGHARAVTYASGVAELAGGVAVAAGASRFARFWLLGTLAAVYPANVWMAFNAERFEVPAWALWARLPVQALFAGHVWVGTGERRGSVR
jgi:uncharacterized membrane protein